MNAIVDTLKTAFPRSEPQSPTEELSETEVDGKSQKANKPRLRFSSGKIAPVLNVAGTQGKITYSSEAEGLSLARMESFIQKQKNLLEAMLKEGLGSEGSGEDLDSSADQDMKSTEVLRRPSKGNDLPESEMPLADTALDLLRLVMMDHWSWLCTENMQKVLHVLSGTLIQRWLEVQVDYLTCTHRWVQYLQLLQELIWPGGVLPGAPKPLRTEEQKAEAKEQALKILMGILPEIILEILGTGKCQESWSLVLESMQHPIINRHMVYCLSDILLEFLIPELQADNPQPMPVASSACGVVERASFSSH